MYAQSNEDDFILNYFDGYKGVLLDIGANDGVTLSNSRQLIENKWTAFLVEPDRKAFGRLDNLYSKHPDVTLYNCAIGDKDEMVTLYASGEHLKKGDTGLLSSVSIEETKRWKGTTSFEPETVVMRTYKSLFENHKFDFISIDAEGMDVAILKQIDLSFTKCLCIEWNSHPDAFKEIVRYCDPFGLHIVKQNAENLILTK